MSNIAVRHVCECVSVCVYVCTCTEVGVCTFVHIDAFYLRLHVMIIALC